MKSSSVKWAWSLSSWRVRKRSTSFAGPQPRLKTRAEALFGLGRTDDAKAAMTEASRIAPAEWMVETSQEQLERLRRILAAQKTAVTPAAPGL